MFSRSFTQALRVSTRAVAPSARFVRFASSVPKAEIESRVINTLKMFKKDLETVEITPSTNLAKDLKLDSLETVEAIVAIEEEFEIEIPDKVSDEIQTVQQAVDYIASCDDAH